jgi:hypothetical protein
VSGFPYRHVAKDMLALNRYLFALLISLTYA